MAVREILLLGNPRLYEISKPVEKEELVNTKPIIDDLHDTLMNFRSKNNAGRAIAAPQIGIMKQIIYMHINEPVVFLNPILDNFSKETMEIWDDCMSFPGILVKVQRYKKCRIIYKDLYWHNREMHLEDNLSELLQHETDHLNGILAVFRAIDGKSFALKSQNQFLK